MQMQRSWEKLSREEKQRNHPKNPSFSSTLLDEIYNSIDGNKEDGYEIKTFRNKSTRKPNNDVDYVKVKAAGNCREAEEMASLNRACLMEKFMEKKINEKVLLLRNISCLQELNNIGPIPDNDPMFFSTSSSSCSDSSSGLLSSSDAELFYSSAPTKSRTITSCFSAKSSSKPNKSTANVPPRPRRNNHQNSLHYKQSECYHFDENADNLMKSKSKALRMYNNLKKVKQPISPGGRLTSLLTSLFASGNVKKSKEEVKPSSRNASTCSSASSFSRSCLSKSVPNPGKVEDFDVRKRVNFYPVSIIVNDSRPCGHKSVCDEQIGRVHRQHGSYQSTEALKLNVLERKKNIDEKAARDVFLKGWKDEEKVDNFDEDVDRISDSSSDLFEIDHLRVFGNNRFCEELPVYETTRLDRNRVIASALKF